ncbi:MAG TPA: hypothetical protein VF432_13600 [Thermoanaerobaculia bacterium]
MLPGASEQERIPIRDDVSRLYRSEAIEHYQRGRTDEAHLLELEPRWTRYAYRVVLVLLTAAVLAGVWWVRRG